MARLATLVRDRRLTRRIEQAQIYGWIVRKRLRAHLDGRLRRSRREPRQPIYLQPAHAVWQLGPRHLVVVGDSLAAGIGDPVPGLSLVGWADRLALALRSRSSAMDYTNLAVKGLTTSQIAARQLPLAQALAPDLIILSAGGNDLLARRWDPDAFRHAYAALLTGLLATGATVFTTSWHNLPLAVPMPTALAQRYSQRLAEAGAIVRAVSEALGAVCVDFWALPELLDARCYSADGTHPNARGYLCVAQILARVLAQHVGLPLDPSSLYHPAETYPAPAPRRTLVDRLPAYLRVGARHQEVLA